MATLFNTKIKDTYQSLLKLEDNTILTTTVKNVTDGLGNASPLYMSTTQVRIATTGGSFQVRSSSDSSSSIVIGNDTANSRLILSGGESNNGSIATITANSGVRMRMRGSYLTIANSDVDPNNTPSLFGIRGTGSTSATTSLLVQNSSSNTTFQVLDNGLVYVGTGFTGLSFSGANSQIFNNGGSAGRISFAMGGVSYLEIYQPINNGGGFTSGTLNNISTPFTYTNTSGAVSYNLLSISPGINNTGTYTGTIRGIYYNPSITSLTGTTHIALETVTGNVLLGTTSGNVMIGTSTDAGYKLDVNGTVRIQNTLRLNSNFEIASSAVICGISRVPGNGPGMIFTENMQSGQIPFQFASGYNSPATKGFLNSGGRSILNINIGLGSPNADNLDASVLLLDGIHNVTSATGTTIRGIYYNPTITSLTGVVAHRAIETTSGDIVFNGGNVLIGTSTNSSYKLDVNGTTRVNGVLTVGNSTITGNYGGMSLNNNGVAGVSLSFTNSRWGSDNPCVLGDQGAHAHSSAQLEVKSSAKGFLPPRMTNAQKLAINLPAAGLQVYDTTLNQMSYFNGTTWVNF